MHTDTQFQNVFEDMIWQRGAMDKLGSGGTKLYNGIKDNDIFQECKVKLIRNSRTIRRVTTKKSIFLPTTSWSVQNQLNIFGYSPYWVPQLAYFSWLIDWTYTGHQTTTEIQLVSTCILNDQWTGFFFWCHREMWLLCWYLRTYWHAMKFKSMVDYTQKTICH